MDFGGIRIEELTEEQMSYFYSNLTDNLEPECLVGQYVIIKSLAGDSPRLFRWNGTGFYPVPFISFTSELFGTIKPKNGDLFQLAYMDSLVRNQLTIATGPAGSGKSLIALSYAFQEFKKNHFDKIVVFTNPMIAEGAIKLGFMPGTKTEKLLETSIGSILISKLGGRANVEKLIAAESLVLMPMGDCRGYEVPKKCFVYFTEAQNTNRYLMKLFLQRVNDSCKICIEGDLRQQDSDKFSSESNGLKRAIEVFSGEEYASHIQLQRIYRGRIASKAEEI